MMVLMIESDQLPINKPTAFRMIIIYNFFLFFSKLSSFVNCLLYRGIL